MLSSYDDKPFLFPNVCWRIGKVIPIDFGVLGNVINKLAAVAFVV